MVLREPLARRLILAVVPEAHEGAVEAPAEEQLGGRFDAAEQAEDAVIGRRKVADVDGNEQEADDLDGDVADAVDRQVLRELANLLEQGVSVSGT